MDTRETTTASPDGQETKLTTLEFRYGEHWPGICAICGVHTDLCEHHEYAEEPSKAASVGAAVANALLKGILREMGAPFVRGGLRAPVTRHKVAIPICRRHQGLIRSTRYRDAWMFICCCLAVVLPIPLIIALAKMLLVGMSRFAEGSVPIGWRLLIGAGMLLTWIVSTVAYFALRKWLRPYQSRLVPLGVGPESMVLGGVAIELAIGMEERRKQEEARRCAEVEAYPEPVAVRVVQDHYDELYPHTVDNREEVAQSISCGCFRCCQCFSPAEVTHWIGDGSGNEENTALCPHCGADAVIGSAAGYPITYEFLESMNSHWA